MSSSMIVLLRALATLAFILASIQPANAANPSTCAAIKQATPASADGDYVLYMAGDAAKPWNVWCNGMATATPKEYLTLARTGTGLNYSYQVYKKSEPITIQNTTSYTKLRINPVTLVVDPTDSTFAQSNGGDNRKLAYASALACLQATTGRANIDLRGTPFSVAPNAFITSGAVASGGSHYSVHNQVVNLTAAGYCGATNAPGGHPDFPVHESHWRYAD